MANKNYKSKVNLTATIEDLDKEEWRPIEEFHPEIFMISNYGRVKRKATEFIRSDGRISRKAETIVKPSYCKIRGRDYLHVALCYNGVCRNKIVHILVAKAFIPNPNNKPEVNHIDGNKHNNCVDNLEWVTRAENMHHARTTGLITYNVGDKHHKSIKVIAYDFKTKAKIATFESATIAAKFCGSKYPNHIFEVCDGKREYAFGYFWSYYNENETVTTNENASA